MLIDKQQSTAHIKQRFSLRPLAAALTLSLLNVIPSTAFAAEQLYSKPALTMETPRSMTITTTPTYENCGVSVRIPTGYEVDELHLEYRKAGDAEYKLAHPFTVYDTDNAATSLFFLDPNTEYEIKVTAVSGSIGYIAEETFRTRAPFVVPIATRTVSVSNDTELTAALAAASGGQHIVLEPGVYQPISLNARQFTAEAPLVIRGEYNKARPHFRGSGEGSGSSIYLNNSSHIIFDHIETSEGGDSSSGKGVYIRASSNITVQNSVIREGGRFNILISKSHVFSRGVTEGGQHLIQNNKIYDEQYENCNDAKIQVCDNRTNFGVVSQNYGGGINIIRNNEIYGHKDNVVACSEMDNTNLSDIDNLFAYTGGPTNFNGHDIEIYGNRLYDAADDNIELDGICSNVRVYNNEMGETNYPITIAPAMPGPFFILYNRVFGEWREASVKLNTGAGAADEPTRNAFFYHNSFVRENSGALLKLYYDHPEHHVPIENINFYNNIFVSVRGGLQTTAINNGAASVHPTFDYNLWYSGGSENFDWHNNENYSFAEFQRNTGQEANGTNGDVCFKEDSFILEPNSPAKDRGIIIPNINDNYNGNAPDLGAYEIP